MNEVQNYRQGVMSYYASTGKLPGDINGTGKMGIDSGNTGTVDNDFEFNRDWDEGWLPFYFLNKEGIMDYGYNKGYNIKPGKDSNIIKNSTYYFINANEYSINYVFDEQYSGKNVLELESFYFDRIPADMMKFVDEKMDDGTTDTGKVLANCMANKPEIGEYDTVDEYNGGDSYEDAVREKGTCAEAFFVLDV